MFKHKAAIQAFDMFVCDRCGAEQEMHHDGCGGLNWSGTVVDRLELVKVERQPEIRADQHWDGTTTTMFCWSTHGHWAKQESFDLCSTCDNELRRQFGEWFVLGKHEREHQDNRKQSEQEPTDG